MLINLSNHPIQKWSKLQIDTAKKEFIKIIDIPFPKITPNATVNDIEVLANKYLNTCMDKLKEYPDENNAIHIMGEHNFTFCLVTQFLKKGITCVASTSKRISTQVDDKKITQFNFVKFREYNI